MKVYNTKYDDYYIVVKRNKYMVYAGKYLLPKTIIKWLENNDPIELNMFHYEAINYGYCR